ncbi:E4 ORFD [Bovine mastadenovirus A]|uniref:E4 ORFD n=1 Tax=Bovine mastadenovirus A TaxID=129953 RepID=UPI0000443F9E|nr:E4 ORFD [Bovine mastadenovirus A]
MEHFEVPGSGLICCNSTDSHPVAFVRSPRTAACFAMCLELPVPWMHILSHHEFVFLKRHLCDGVELEMCSVFSKDLQPDFSSLQSRWYLHCHCDNSGSLQCLSSRKVLTGLFQEVLKGTFYNQLFWFYRGCVNKNLPEGLMYMGSVYIRGIHLIYIRVILDGDMKRIRKLNFGEAVYVDGLYGNFLIVICRSCNLSEIQAKVCAKRTRRLLKRAVGCCSGPKQPSKKEVVRQRELLQLMKYGLPMSQKYVKYL